MGIDTKIQPNSLNRVASFLWPYNWLPRTKIRAAIMAWSCMTAHYSLAYAPYATAFFKLDAMWVSGPGVLVRMMPLLALMAITAIIFGLSMRRLVLLFRTEPVILISIFLVMVGVTVILSVASKDVLENAGEKWDKFDGLKIWYTAWAATGAFGLKPIFDEIFDRLHPKDSLPEISDPKTPKGYRVKISLIGKVFRSCKRKFTKIDKTKDDLSRPV